MLNMENWKNEKLRQCVDINSETLNSNTNLDYQFKYIDISSVSKGLIEVPTDLITYGSAPSRARRIFRKGDILFGTVRPYLQSHAYIDFDVKDMIASTGFAVLRAKNDVINKYLYHYIFSDEIQKQIDSLLVGSNYPAINSTDVGNLLINLPPLPEQKKIAEILSTWDEAIETNKRLLTSIEKHRAFQLKNYFMKTKYSSPYKSLEELEHSGSIKLGRGRVISRDEMKLSKGLFPVYSSSIKNNGLMGYIDEYLFDEEMITWSIDGGGNFFYRDKHKFSVTNVSGFMKIIDGNIKVYYLASQLQYLHSKLVFDYQTKAHPSVIRSLYKVQITTLNEQKRFEYLFKSFDKQLEKINQYINELQKQKQGLMQRLLTGKIRVKLD